MKQSWSREIRDHEPHRKLEELLKMKCGMLLQVTSANALAYNVIHNAMIKMTSAVTTTVIGEAKIVGLFILSALLLGG